MVSAVVSLIPNVAVPLLVKPSLKVSGAALVGSKSPALLAHPAPPLPKASVAAWLAVPLKCKLAPLALVSPPSVTVVAELR
jgi:hypothetical protein